MKYVCNQLGGLKSVQIEYVCNQLDGFDGVEDEYVWIHLNLG